VKLYTYPITVKREKGRFYAYSEDFPGVYGLGKSIDEAKASLLDGMKIYIEECRRQRRPVPRTQTIYSETVSLAL
jgi:predicted RNase H-like HicB family nuclease